MTDYLDIHSVNEGYLVIFDGRNDKTWEYKEIMHNGKQIFAVWV